MACHYPRTEAMEVSAAPNSSRALVRPASAPHHRETRTVYAPPSSPKRRLPHVIDIMSVLAQLLNVEFSPHSLPFLAQSKQLPEHLATLVFDPRWPVKHIPQIRIHLPDDLRNHSHCNHLDIWHTAGITYMLMASNATYAKIHPLYIR
jgi:hypothetical protein